MKKGLLYGIIAIISMIGFISCERKPKQIAFLPMAVKQCFVSEIDASNWAISKQNEIQSLYGPYITNLTHVIRDEYNPQGFGSICAYVTWDYPVFD